MQFNRQVNHLSIVSQNSADDDTCVTLTMDGMDRAFDREGNKHFFVQNPPKLEFSRHIFHSFNTYLIKHQQVIIWIYVSQRLDVTFLILVVGIIDFFFVAVVTLGIESYPSVHMLILFSTGLYPCYWLGSVDTQNHVL